MGRGRGIGKNSVKVIFNPRAGMSRRPRAEAGDVAAALRALGFEPDVCIVGPGLRVQDAATEALARGFLLFAVCGGDGTVTAAAGVLAGTGATLAIIPTGSQNNMALSMGIPEEIAPAAALLATGRRTGVDVGMASCSGGSSHFMEICSVGLISALSQSGDAIQHGNLAGLGDFLTTLISSSPAGIELTLDGRRISGSGHVAFVTNMPYVGFHYRVGRLNAHKDGKLNAHFFDGLTKIDLIKYIAGGVYLGKPEDPRIGHFLAEEVDVAASPAMPVMVDGNVIGESPVHITLMPKALHVMCGRRVIYRDNPG